MAMGRTTSSSGLLKGIYRGGRVSGQIFLGLILLVLRANFQELFTEFKKMLRCRDIARQSFEKSRFHFGDVENFIC